MSAIPVEDLGAPSLADVGLGRSSPAPTRRRRAGPQTSGATGVRARRGVSFTAVPAKDAHAGELAEPELVPLIATQQVSSPRSMLARS